MRTPEKVEEEVSPHVWMQRHHAEVIQAFRNHQAAMLGQTEDTSIYERYLSENRYFSEMTACWVMQVIAEKTIPLPTGYTFVDGGVVIHAPSGEVSRAITHKFFKKNGSAGNDTDMIMYLTTPQFMLGQDIQQPLPRRRRTEIFKQRAREAGVDAIVEECGEGIVMVVATRKQFAEVFGLDYSDNHN